MRFSNVCVEAVACHLPENTVTSEDLENRMGPLYERLKLPVGRLELMSGIRERRFWDEGVLPSEVGAIAGEKAIEKIRNRPVADRLPDQCIRVQGFFGACHGFRGPLQITVAWKRTSI